ncbi:Hypothetical protein FKW44_016865 [Caligus rogercresseyi]|uniref:Uncharacterized protein n=1 Tax=Caligus rogercresseyi TaxID=217165 RepID=A0A7T8H307_CALRO|nr:Hypothetical protein FKW44_016865 [Caligus rogercresseyi]
MRGNGVVPASRGVNHTDDFGEDGVCLESAFTLRMNCKQPIFLLRKIPNSSSNKGSTIFLMGITALHS